MKFNIKVKKEKLPAAIVMPPPWRHDDFVELAYPSTNAEPHVEGQRRIFMFEPIYNAIWRHAALSQTNELGGALLGYYGHCEGEDFSIIVSVLNQPPEYYSGLTDLRFTTQFYADIEAFISQQPNDWLPLVRLGMYHTHPNYGVFLSETDLRTFRSVYNLAYQLALVVDPVRRLDGIFFWHEGVITPKAAYQTYQTNNLQFGKRVALSCSSLMAKYNPHIITTDTRVVEKSFKAFSVKNEDAPLVDRLRIQMPAATESSSKQINMGAELPETEGTAKKDRIRRSFWLPKISPLFDNSYFIRSLSLHNYFKAVSPGTINTEYPYAIYFDGSIVAGIDNLLRKANKDSDTYILGLLQGNTYQDPLKKDKYLLLEHADFKFFKIDNKPKDLSIQEGVAHLEHDLGEWLNDAKGELRDIIGWVFCMPGLPSALYPFIEMHQQFFKGKNCLGLVFPQTEDEQQTICHVEKMLIVATKGKVVYNYFRHVFYYQKASTL